MTCPFCFFTLMAFKAEERADCLTAEGLASLAKPHRQAVRDFEALASHEKECRCDEVSGGESQDPL